MTSRLATAVATTSLAGLAVLGMAAPALAQYSGQSSAGASDDTVVLNQTFSITTGDNECDPGTTANVAIVGNGFSDTKTTTADRTGTATIQFTVPSSARAGDASATFTCVLNAATNRVVVPFTVVASTAAAPTAAAPIAAGTTTRGSLPRTGANSVVELSLAGAALVAVGGGLVVAARRRRENAPGGLA